jgi:hypothetical protein
VEKLQTPVILEQNPWQGSAAMVCGVLVLFSFAIGAAMGAYPGGTFFDANRVGYDFWDNFWCDALRNPALNGLGNARGARMASIALWVLSAGLLPFWGMAAELCLPTSQFPNSGARALIRWLGMGAMLGMMGVTLVPSNHFPFLHGFLVTVVGPMGILATWIAVAKGRASPRVPALASLLGTLALLMALVNLTQYARQFWLEAEPSPLLPGIQKLATLFFLSWVLALSAIVLSGQRRARRAAR